MKIKTKVTIPNARVALQISKDVSNMIQGLEVDKLREEVAAAITSSPLTYCIVGVSGISKEVIHTVTTELIILDYMVKHTGNVLEIDWGK